MLVHYLWLLDWLGKDKIYQQALSTNTGHACSVKMALVKLDPWGFLNAVFHLLACVNVDSPICATHSSGVTLDIADLWMAPQPSERVFVWCTFASVCLCVCLHTCACIWFIVWSLQSFNPLICWTLEITVVICQLGQSRLQGSTQAHARTHTMIVVVFLTGPASFQSNKDWCSSFQASQVLH